MPGKDRVVRTIARELTDGLTSDGTDYLGSHPSLTGWNGGALNKKALQVERLQSGKRVRRPRSALRQIGTAHQVAIALAGRAAALVDRPNDQTLPATAIAGGEDPLDRGRVLLVLGLDIGTGVGLEVEVLEQGLLRPEESHGQQHELGGPGLFRAGNLLRHELALVVLAPLDLDGDEFLYVTRGVADKLLHGRNVDARVGAVLGGGLLLAVVQLVGLRPLGPGVVGRALQRRLGENLDLEEALAAVAHRRADAVRAGVAATDDDDVLAGGVDRAGTIVAENGLGVGGEKLHRKVHSLEAAALDGQVARLGGAGADDRGVILLEEDLGLDVVADVGVADELDALLLHELDAAQDDLLLVQLHVGDAVHEQAARAVGALEDGDGVAGAIELRGGGQTGGAGADDGDLLAGADLGRLGDDPALRPALVDDRDLDVLDRDRRGVDAEHAGALAGRRAHAASELGEIVRLVQALERLVPEAAVNEIVPLRDQVVDRAARGHAADELAGVAEGNAAIHAARTLGAELLLLHVVVEFLPVAHALGRRAVGGQFAQVLDEAGWFTHGFEAINCQRSA